MRLREVELERRRALVLRMAGRRPWTLSPWTLRRNWAAAVHPGWASGEGQSRATQTLLRQTSRHSSSSNRQQTWETLRPSRVSLVSLWLQDDLYSCLTVVVPVSLSVELSETDWVRSLSFVWPGVLAGKPQA